MFLSSLPSQFNPMRNARPAITALPASCYSFVKRLLSDIRIQYCWRWCMLSDALQICFVMHIALLYYNPGVWIQLLIYFMYKQVVCDWAKFGQFIISYFHLGKYSQGGRVLNYYNKTTSERDARSGLWTDAYVKSIKFTWNRSRKSYFIELQVKSLPKKSLLSIMDKIRLLC